MKWYFDCLVNADDLLSPLKKSFGRQHVRIGLLGAGRIGRIHGRNVAAHPRVSLAAVADASADAAKSLAEQHGAKVASIDAILGDKDIGAVVICTPTDMHSGLIEKAAQAGKAVFCEKP